MGKAMERAIFIVLVSLLGASIAFGADSPNEYYGTGLCGKSGFECIKVQRGQSWQNLFPDENQRDLVQRLNRTDTYLYPGKTLAVPKDLKDATIYSISPFPLRIKKLGEKLIMVNQDQLAWGAYDPEGQLIKWGPISSGKNYCRDVNRSCETITGIFYVFHKKGPGCKSNVFPVETSGGAVMPYCMFFFKGYALHGSNEVTGYRDSHGCVRLFKRDAKWLNENFVNVATKDGHLGTKVVVEKLTIGE
ncbi:Enhanced entry protein EnhA [Coxiella burnetii str. Namibia]|nr:Enhanced entry protein EnhA [Coxiella burnetii str. Namibia]